MDLSPWQCRRGQSHFRGDHDRLQGNTVFAAKIGTVPVNAYLMPRPQRFRESWADWYRMFCQDTEIRELQSLLGAYPFSPRTPSPPE